MEDLSQEPQEEEKDDGDGDTEGPSAQAILGGTPTTPRPGDTHLKESGCCGPHWSHQR